MSVDDAIEAIEGFIHIEVKWPGTEKTVEALELAITALHAQQEREKNKPLTLDELRKLNGEPVWLVDGDGNELWGLVDATNDPPEVFDSQYGLWFGEFYNMIGDEKMGLHSEGWVAYRHKPKEERQA